MNDAEFQHSLHADPPITIRFGTRCHPEIVLDADGFTVKSFPAKHYEWNHVSAFTIKRPWSGFGRTNKMLLFNDNSRTTPSSLILRLLTGHDAYITGYYVPREEFEKVTQLLNHWRERIRLHNLPAKAFTLYSSG